MHRVKLIDLKGQQEVALRFDRNYVGATDYPHMLPAVIQYGGRYYTRFPNDSVWAARADADGIYTLAETGIFNADSEPHEVWK
jgi:hypothetical protein